jgi:hypothetical protein
MFTLISREASASAFAPSAPTRLYLRLSVVTVFHRNLKISTRKTKEKNMFTLVSRKALASAFAPSSPI